MQADIDKTLRNLGVIAALSQNDKLLTEGEFFSIYIPTAMRSLVRMLYRESREQNMKRVGECIRCAKTFATTTLSEFGNEQSNDTNETLATKIHRHNQVQVCTRVLTALSETVGGLDNLIQTYRDDAALVVKIRNLKSEVLDFIENTQLVAQRSPVIRRLN